MEPDAESISEPPNPTNAYPPSRGYNLRHSRNGIVMNTTHNKFQACLGTIPGTSTYTIHLDFGIVLRNGYGTTTYPPTKLLVSPLEQHRIVSRSFLRSSLFTEVTIPRSRKTYPLYLKMPYKALPETPPNIPQTLATDTIRSTHKLLLYFWGYSLPTHSNATHFCNVTTGYIQLTNYSKQ